MNERDRVGYADLSTERFPAKSLLSVGCFS